MTKTWIKIVLTGALAAGLFACDSKDSQPPANGNPAESGAAGEGQAPANQVRVLQIKVALDGSITFDNAPVTIDELNKNIAEAKAAGPCVIWYYREKGPGPAPAFVKPIVDVLMANKVDVNFASKPDFSDMIAKEQARAAAGNKVSAADAMRELRRSTLADGPAKIGIQPTKDFARTYGVVMDFPTGSPDHPIIGSVVSLSNGDSSFFTTANFGIIGAGGQEAAKNATLNFVMAADATYDDGAPTTEFPYPLQGRIRIYLMTFQGVRVIDTDVESIASGKSKYANLFGAGQNVLTELRKTAEQRAAGTAGATQPATTQAGPSATTKPAAP